MTQRNSLLQQPTMRLIAGFKILAVAGLVAVPVSFRSVDLPNVEQVRSVADLQQFFAHLDYSLATVRDGRVVPRLSISDVPDEWSQDLEPEVRKKLFFKSVLPLVLIVNEQIQRDRDRLRDLDARLRSGSAWSTADRRWFTSLAQRHGIDYSPDPAEIADRGKAISLLRARMGPIPPSLALAQAAVESGYGTSRFAVSGNALFGQWTSGKGIRPQDQRSSKAAYRIASFGTPLESVEAYARNLNSHRAYRNFRQTRRKQEQGGTQPTGLHLIPTLAAYSEKGTAYIGTLRQIIQINGLAHLDKAELGPGKTTRLRIP